MVARLTLYPEMLRFVHSSVKPETHVLKRSKFLLKSPHSTSFEQSHGSQFFFFRHSQLILLNFREKKSSNFRYQKMHKKKDFLCYEAIPTFAMNTQLYQNRLATNPPVLMQFPPSCEKEQGHQRIF
jgi:hypothetical protein